MTDSPATSSSWADSGLPPSEHRVGRRITELQKQTQQHESLAQPESEESQLDAAGTMLLSEVNLGGAGGSAEPLPSSRVKLNDGRVVNVIGNVSGLSCLAKHLKFSGVHNLRVTCTNLKHAAACSLPRASNPAPSPPTPPPPPPNQSCWQGFLCIPEELGCSSCSALK